jgi:hypothetical protein
MAVKELAELDYLKLRYFPRKGKEFQGSYYEIYDHKAHRNKRSYLPPTIERITDSDLMKRLYLLSWKDEAGNTIYLNNLQTEKESMDMTSGNVSLGIVLNI